MRVENKIRVAKFDKRDNNFLYCSFEYNILKLGNVSFKNKIFDINIVTLIKRMFLAKYLNFIKYVFEVAREMMFHVNKIKFFKK